MAGPKNSGPGAPPPEDDQDWAKALDEWDAQIDDALGPEANVAPDPDLLVTEFAVPALPPRGTLDEPLPLDEPPSLGESAASLAMDEPLQLDHFGFDAMMTAPQEALPHFSVDDDEQEVLTVLADDEASETTFEAESEAESEITHVADREVTRVADAAEIAPMLEGPAYDDEDLEVSIELSSAVDHAVTMAAAPALIAADEDFYDDISIIPGSEDSVKKPVPVAAAVKQPEEELWSEPALVAARVENDPDRTPLPVAEEVPGHQSGLHLTVTGAEAVVPQRALVAARVTAPSTLLQHLERGDERVAFADSDRHALRRLLDSERALAVPARVAALAFEAARLSLALDDLDGAVERAEIAIHAQPGHEGATRLLRKAAIERGELDAAATLLVIEQKSASARERAGLSVIASAVADSRGLHDDARAVDVQADDPAAHFVALAYSASQVELVACRSRVSDPADHALVTALDLELARQSEQGREPAAARDSYRRILGSAPGDIHAALGLMRGAIVANDSGLERDALLTLVAAAPDSRLRRALERRLAALQFSTGDDQAGRARLAALADAGDAFSARLWMGSAGACAGAMSDFEIARIETVVRTSTDEGQRAAARIELGAAEERRGQTGAAILAYSAASTDYPTDRRAERALERVRSIGGDKQIELERLLRVAAADEGRAPFAWVRAAALLTELDRSNEAMERLAEALDRRPADAEALAAWDKLALAAQDPGRAAARLVAAADSTSDPAQSLALRRRAVALYAKAGMTALAHRLLEAWKQPTELGDLIRIFGLSDLAMARDQLGRVAEEGSATEKARAYFERSLLAASPEEAIDDLRAALVAAPQLAAAAALFTRATAKGYPQRAETLEARHAALSSEEEAAGSAEELVTAALGAALALAFDDEDPGRALALMEQSPALASSISLRAQRGALARSRGAEPALRALYEPILAEALPAEDRAVILYEWARSTQRAQSTEGVTEHLRGAFEAMPEIGLYRATLEHALEKSGDTARLTELALLDLREAADTRTKVKAYERLAFIDECLRGDVGSARMSYQSIAELDQNDHDATRRLERYLITERRRADLVHLYDRMGIAASEPFLAVAVTLERARLRRAIADNELHSSEIDAAIDNDLRLALFQDPRSRPALHEAYARATEQRDHAQRGALAQRLAEQSLASTPPDQRAAAVFMCRAADSAFALGRTDDGLARLRDVVARTDAHLPALLALLEMTLKRRDLAGAAYVAEQVQQVQRERVGRRNAGLLAAAMAVRDLQDQPRAIRVLRAVLEADPKADLAFERLRTLLAEGGEWEGLAALTAAHLEVATDVREQVSLRVELGRISAEHLGRPAEARQHLQAALAQEAADPEALSVLATLEDKEGRYAEAAELLLRRAKVERSRTVLSSILFRLGELYTRHLEDAKRAVACLTRVLQVEPTRRDALLLLVDAYTKDSDWTGASASIQRLIAVESDPVARIPLLHRAARIQEDGLKDPRQALALYRAALELDPLNLSAIEALAQHFDRQSDIQSLRVLVDTTARRLRTGLTGGPRDAGAFRSLFSVFTLRRAPDRAAIAAGVLDWMGAINADEKQSLDRMRTREQYPGSMLAEPSVDELLFDARVPAGFRHLMRIVEEPLSKSFRADLKQLGITRADKIAKSGNAIREVGNRVAADLGIRDYDLYVSPALKRSAILELTDPLSMCIGSELVEGAHEHELRFLFARMFKMVQCRLTLALRLPADALAVLVAGVVRQFISDYQPAGVDSTLIAAEAVRVQRSLSRKMLQEAHPFALECAAPGADPRAISEGVVAAADRAGLLACGAPGPALAMLERMGHADAARALALFAVGEELPELRRIVGTSIG